MRNTKSKIIIVMCIALCFMIVGYAAFSTSLSITGTSNITSTWKVEFTKIEEVSKTSGVTIVNSPTASGTSATFNVGLALPGDKIVYRITLENKGTIDAKVQNIVASATDSPAIIFNMSGIKIGEEIKKQTTKTFDVVIEYDSFVTSQPEKINKALTVDITIVQSTGASSSLNDPTIDQPLYEYSFLSSAILRDNIAYADNVSSAYVTNSTGIRFDRKSSDTNGKGLYYTNTNTENNLSTYYFRGAVENNYVQFGQDSSGNYLYWKIVRINEDGSVRLIYNGTSTTATGSDVTIGNSAFNATSGDNAYGGYMYGLPESTTVYGDIDGDGKINAKERLYICAYVEGKKEPTAKELFLADITLDGTVTSADCDLITRMTALQTTEVYYEYNLNDFTSQQRYNKTHANVNDSTIKQFLDDWYETNLSSYSTYLADAGFCNDRSVASTSGTWNSSDEALGYGTSRTYYGAYNRLSTNKSPQFACPNEDNDLFTTKTSNKGNKALTHPIGLITADELWYAGAIRANNTEFYLCTGAKYWTMSPFYYYGYHVSEWEVDGKGYMSTYNVYQDDYGVRPVVNLKSTVELSTELPEGCTKLDGTETCPYIIKTN